MMPYGDANAIVVDMAREVLPIVKNTPVLAGVCGTDPFRLMRVFLPELQRLGFDGVQNFPTVGLIDGQFRQILEETGMSIQLEVDMIATAHQLGMLTCPYVFDEDTAERFTRAGADVVVAHVNTTVAGSIGVKTAAMSLDEAVERVQSMHDAAKRVNPDVIVLCHGGPIATPEDAQYVLERTRGVAGFFGASSIERLATESAIEEQARRFKSIRITSSESSPGVALHRACVTSAGPGAGQPRHDTTLGAVIVIAERSATPMNRSTAATTQLTRRGPGRAA